MTSQPASVKNPQHVGIIMDGNGRWAQQRGMTRIDGHRQGVETCRTVIEACRERGIEYLTLYAFSAENWKRPETEVGALMELLKFFLDKELEQLTEQGIRVRAIGRIEELPESARESLQNAIDKTVHLDQGHLILALNYSSRNEIIDAAKSFANQVATGAASASELDWESFAHGLYTDGIPDPDLIIRTSGEHRLSNFLMMQSAYSELYFTDTCWPEFSRADFELAIETYRKRERRYGLTGEQLKSQAPA